MKITRPAIDVTIISYEGPNTMFQFRGSDALYWCHKSTSKLFMDAYNCDKHNQIIIAHNDQGVNIPDVLNMFDYKHLAHKCFPDWDFCEESYDTICKNLSLNGDKLWEINKLCWIGSAQSNLRKEFMKIESDRIYCLNLFNLNNTHLNQSDIKKSNIREEQQRYRYIIDLPSGLDDEEKASPRVKYLLHSKRLIFMVDRQLYDWVTCKMEPFVHYIPVKEDFSDLFEKIEWADTHPVEVEQIIKNATSIAPFRRDAINQISNLINGVFS